MLDGSDIPLGPRRGLLHFEQGRDVRIADCEVVNTPRHGICLEGIEGEITSNSITAGDAAIFSLDARGLTISGNSVRGATRVTRAPSRVKISMSERATRECLMSPTMAT